MTKIGSPWWTTEIVFHWMSYIMREDDTRSDLLKIYISMLFHAQNDRDEHRTNETIEFDFDFSKRQLNSCTKSFWKFFVAKFFEYRLPDGKIWSDCLLDLAGWNRKSRWIIWIWKLLVVAAIHRLAEFNAFAIRNQRKKTYRIDIFHANRNVSIFPVVFTVSLASLHLRPSCCLFCTCGHTITRKRRGEYVYNKSICNKCSPIALGHVFFRSDTVAKAIIQNCPESLIKFKYCRPSAMSDCVLFLCSSISLFLCLTHTHTDTAACSSINADICVAKPNKK